MIMTPQVMPHVVGARRADFVAHDPAALARSYRDALAAPTGGDE